MIHNTTLPGLFTVSLPTNFEDFRGSFLELYKKDTYKNEIQQATGFDIDFVQDNASTSTKHVLRGFHGDSVTWKLITCLKGRIYFVVLNYDKESPYYLKHQGFTLSDKNGLQLLIPPNSAGAQLVMSDYAILHYKQSQYYNRASQFTVLWNDERLGVHWPINNPILSERDTHGDNI